MEPFFPFIHQIPKKELEQLPLYIELDSPIIEDIEKDSEDEEEVRVIIMDLW